MISSFPRKWTVAVRAAVGSGIRLDLEGPIVVDAKYSAHASLRLSHRTSTRRSGRRCQRGQVLELTGRRSIVLLVGDDGDELTVRTPSDR